MHIIKKIIFTQDQGPQSWGAMSPHFLLQMQFLTAFLDYRPHRVTKFCKVTRTATKILVPNCRKSYFQSSSFQNFLRSICSDPSRWIAPSALNHAPPPHSKLCLFTSLLKSCLRFRFIITCIYLHHAIFLATCNASLLYL